MAWAGAAERASPGPAGCPGPQDTQLGVQLPSRCSCCPEEGPFPQGRAGPSIKALCRAGACGTLGLMTLSGQAEGRPLCQRDALLQEAGEDLPEPWKQREACLLMRQGLMGPTPHDDSQRRVPAGASWTGTRSRQGQGPHPTSRPSNKSCFPVTGTYQVPGAI